MKIRCHLTLIALGLITSSIGVAQPVITIQPQDQTNVLGTTSTFSVTATGTAPLDYQWSFGSPQTNLTGATTAALVITNVQTANQGPYQVVITNLQGAVTSLVANLYVTAPATVQFATNLLTVTEGAGQVTVAVQRSGNTNLAMAVDYSTSDGNAANGTKYTAVSGTLSFGPGETNKS